MNGTAEHRLADLRLTWFGRLPDSWDAPPLCAISKIIVPMRDKPKDLSGPIVLLEIFTAVPVPDTLR